MMDPKATEISSRYGRTMCISFKPDGRHFVAGSSVYLQQWEIDNREINPSVMQSSNAIYAVAASMDGQWIVSGDLGNHIIIWNAVTHTIVRQISEHTNYVYAVDISSDSTRIASASQDYTVRIFNVISGVRVIPPLEHDSAPIAVKFSPDGSRVATAMFTCASVYDAHSGNKLFSFAVQISWTPITPFAWSSDGQQLFVASPGKIIYFDTSTSFRSEWLIKNSESNVCIVTHGRFMACAAGSSVSFWDYTSRQQIGGVIDHATSVYCISVSHDGRFLACGRDGGITVHNLGDFLPRDYLRVPRVSRFPLMQVSDTVLESWMLGNQADTESRLSQEIAQFSNPSYHTLAARSLIRSRLKEWTRALEDAETSLQIEQSPIGHIARSLALVGAGKQEVALDDFDFVFRDCDSSDNALLLVIKSIFVFLCGKHKQAVSRLRGSITAADESTKGQYIQVLGNMYLKQGDYENAVQTLVLAKNNLSTAESSNPLTTIYLIFDWNFDRLEATAWQRLCEYLYASERIKEVGETLVKMVNPLAEDEKEPAHGRILEELVTRSGQVTLLLWTGKSSTCNSCLPSSPAVYSHRPFVPSRIEPTELEKRTDELRTVFSLIDSLVIYVRATSLQPVRFANFRLHLPCIVFGVRSLQKDEENIYHAEIAGLGHVELSTTDSLPTNEPWRLVLVDLRVHGLLEPHGPGEATWEARFKSRVESNPSDVRDSVADTDAELVHAPIIEEVPSVPQLDTYTRALQLIAHLGQPFSALLLLEQSDGAYKRVASDHEIIIQGVGNNVPKDIRVEVLEVL